MKIIYVNCRVKNYLKEGHRICIRNLCMQLGEESLKKNSGRKRGSHTRVEWNGERIYRHSFLLCFLNKYHQIVRHDAYLPLWLKKKSSLQAMELLIRTSATYMSSTFWSRKLAFLKVNIYISLEIFQWPFFHVAFVAFVLYQSALLLNFAMC